MTHLVLSGFTPVSATCYPISPEFSNSNPQDLTTSDSNFSLSDNNKIVERTYIANLSRVKLIMNRLVHRYCMKKFVFSYENPHEPIGTGTQG